MYEIASKEALKKRENKATSARADGHYVNARLNLIDDPALYENRWPAAWISVAVSPNNLKNVLLQFITATVDNCEMTLVLLK